MTPKPLMGTVCGLPRPLSVIVIDAVRDSSRLGVKVTLMVQCAFGARLEPHVLLSAKSGAFVPPIAIPLMVSVAAPTFVSVTLFRALVVPSTWSANFKLEGERVILPSCKGWQLRHRSISGLLDRSC